MATTASPDLRMTSAEFLALVDQGVLGPDDKVELLEGVLVTMAPSGPLHASIVTRTQYALYDRLRGRAAVRSQVSFVASALSVPEPDITVAPGDESRYEEMHPEDAHLLVEVAASSVAADRLSKSRIYAAAGIAEFWLVNLRDDQLEVFRGPDRELGVYTKRTILRRGDRVTLVAFPDVTLDVAALLPTEPLPAF